MTTLKFNAKIVRLNKASMYFYTGNANHLIPIIGKLFERRFINEFSELITDDEIEVFSKYDTFATITPLNQSIKEFNLESLVTGVESVLNMHIERSLMLFEFKTYLKYAIRRIKTIEAKYSSQSVDLPASYSN